MFIFCMKFLVLCRKNTDQLLFLFIFSYKGGLLTLSKLIYGRKHLEDSRYERFFSFSVLATLSSSSCHFYSCFIFAKKMVGVD